MAAAVVGRGCVALLELMALSPIAKSEDPIVTPRMIYYLAPLLYTTLMTPADGLCRERYAQQLFVCLFPLFCFIFKKKKEKNALVVAKWVG